MQFQLYSVFWELKHENIRNHTSPDLVWLNFDQITHRYYIYFVFNFVSMNMLNHLILKKTNIITVIITVFISAF